MNKEQVIAWAREVGYPLAEYEAGPYVPPMLETLLKHAVAAEREACAKMAEAFHQHQYDFTGNLELHEAIRARGETK